MGIQDETTCIATPGFAGFVPSMSMKFGMTYGNATRDILKTDPSMKKGEIQQNLLRKLTKQNIPTDIDTISTSNNGGKYLWERRDTYATGDDRFSFPPVPGYTGYIPRSQDHFGRPFVETTNASLLDFQKMLKSKNTLPPKVLAIQKARKEKEKEKRDIEKNNKDQSVSAVHISSFDPYSQPYTDEMSPYKLPKNHPQKTFISGYTGYVPRLQHHFGEPYPHSVRRAIDDFSQPPLPSNPYILQKGPKKHELKAIMTKPIPGFTGFIPGGRTCYSMSFGRTSEVAYDQFNSRDEKGRLPVMLPSMPPKDLSKNRPIPGYRGHKSLKP